MMTNIHGIILINIINLFLNHLHHVHPSLIDIIYNLLQQQQQPLLLLRMILQMIIDKIAKENFKSIEIQTEVCGNRKQNKTKQTRSNLYLYYAFHLFPFLACTHNFMILFFSFLFCVITGILTFLFRFKRILTRIVIRC